MSELVFLKLGGSLITDKGQPETPRPAVIQRLAREIRLTMTLRPDLRLVLGHGSGSFGHVAAERYGVHLGNLADWMGYAQTAAAAARLNRLVTEALLAEGVPAVSLPPSASARCHARELVALAVDPVAELLRRGAVPLVYGDVALDEVQGSAIVSTEQVFAHLARALRPQRVILAGEVAGVFTGDPQRDAVVRLVPEILSRDLEDVEDGLGAALGTDVTGGMLSKVRLLCALVQELPNLQARIITGRRSGVVQRVLLDPTLAEGTLVRY